ncbi:hypothetical protein [Hydrocoleum sp. CS-953]|uniref:hypothetical protein n=1 Tax=Hydrocoleum sp. CS-953 TaxID=1671698 RepID=UPI00143CE432|nr:hypothetical protein [Hydrocoleum sp. CS-953]
MVIVITILRDYLGSGGDIATAFAAPTPLTYFCAMIGIGRGRMPESPYMVFGRQYLWSL